MRCRGVFTWEDMTVQSISSTSPARLHRFLTTAHSRPGGHGDGVVLALVLAPMLARLRHHCCLATLVVIAGAGCGQSTIINPSGTCGTRPGEVRAGYHVPDKDDTWVPDCQNALAREYWRVYSKDGRTGYVVPRPDGAPQLMAPCADSQHELNPLVVRYQLCSAASRVEQVALINQIALSDALVVARFLHKQLKFAVTQNALGIQPFPISADIVDACALAEGKNSSDLEAICKRERDRLRSGIDIGFSYTGDGAGELVARLNQLYGIL